jgi:hypothetical protein
MPRSDQRRDTRQPLQTSLQIVDIESGIEFRAESLDTCSGGLAFHAPMEPALGAELEVTFGEPGAPSSAFKVLRINANDSGFDVAGTL